MDAIAAKSSRSSVTPSADSGINHCMRIHPRKKTMAFIRAGQRPTAAPRTSSSTPPPTAQDWELKIDFGKQLPSSQEMLLLEQ